MSYFHLMLSSFCPSAPSHILKFFLPKHIHYSLGRSHLPAFFQRFLTPSVSNKQSKCDSLHGDYKTKGFEKWKVAYTLRVRSTEGMSREQLSGTLIKLLKIWLQNLKIYSPSLRYASKFYYFGVCLYPPLFGACLKSWVYSISTTNIVYNKLR